MRYRLAIILGRSEQPWLAGGAVIFRKKIAGLLQQGDILSLIPTNLAGSWSNGKSKEIGTIAIVDDQPRDFPIQDQRSDNYNATSHKQVSLPMIAKLAAYDIVFLDIKGIVKDDPDYGGLKLIAELRKINPDQKICSVSSQLFDPTATEFFRQANDNKRKPLTAQECKKVIDEFLSEIFDIPRLISEAEIIFKNSGRQRRNSMISDLRSYISSTTDLDKLDQNLTTTGLSKQERSTLCTLARAIKNAP